MAAILGAFIDNQKSILLMDFIEQRL